MALPANVDTGLVTGGFVVGVIDGPDPDSEPDAIPAQGTVTFTASVPYLPNPSASVTILKAPIVAILDSEGWLCVRRPDGTAGARGVRLVATDDPDLSVQGWTWTVTYTFENVNGVTPRIASHSMALPADATIDLTSVVKVPSSVGIGVEQAEALAASAQTAAAEAAAAAVLAAEAAQPTDTGVATLVTYGGATTATLDRIYRAHTSVTEYGATGDGVTDDTAAVQAALAATPGGSVYFPPGSYRLTESLTVSAGTSISGADASSVLLDWSTKTGFMPDALLSWEPGTLDAPVPLTADTAVGDGTVTISEPHDFQAGDYIRITSDEVLHGEMVKAELHRVLGVTAGTLTLSSPVFDTYTLTLAGRVERANLSTGGLSGVTIRGQGINPDGYGDNATHFQLARDVHINDVRFQDVENKCVLLDSVLGVNVTGNHFRFAPSYTPLQYGIAIAGASQMVTIQGCSSWNDRHMVTTSTSAVLAESHTAGRGIPRIITITGCTAHGSWQCPIDTHRGGEYITVTGNALTTDFTGIKIRGKHSLVTGNVIVGRKTSPIGAPVGIRIGMLCEDVQVTGNLIRGFDSGVRIDTPDAGTRALVVSENSILDCVYGVYIGADTPLAEIRIAGNLLRVTETGFGVYIIASITGLELTGNTLDGGHTGIYCASADHTLRDVSIQGNTARGQSSRAMYLLNVTDGLVVANFAPGADLRFHGASPGVTASLNQATITDTSTPGVTQP